jgi:hypothetical protein
MKSKKAARLAITLSVALIVIVGIGAVLLRAGSGKNELPDLELSNFSVNGYQLGMDIDEIDTSNFTPTTGVSANYQFNYRENTNSAEVRYSADSENRLNRLFLDVGYDGAYIPTALRVDGSGTGYIPYTLKNLEQVTKFFGDGNRGWQDREQGLRYVEYTQKEGRQAATVRFVYTDGEHRLIWVIADSSLPYPAPIIDKAALAQMVDESEYTEIIGYISNFNVQTFEFDEFEWLTDVNDGERLAELGLNETNTPSLNNGFAIYNPDDTTQTIWLTTETLFQILEEGTSKTVGADEFAPNLNKYEPLLSTPYRVKVAYGKSLAGVTRYIAVEITEQYLP